MHRIYKASALGIVLISPVSMNAADVPLAGCYERVYDTAHLAAHKGQLATRSTLLVKKASVAGMPGFEGIVAGAELHMWVRDSDKRFDTSGLCTITKGGLSCGGSLSAAESDTCKPNTTGIRRCRVNPADAGGFEIDKRPDGVTVTIMQRLELVPAPYDAPPFLNLSGWDKENRSFLLKPAPAQTCE